MTDLPMPAPSSDLTVLATQINAEHAEVIKHVQQGADHAIRAGRFLLDARIEVPSGHFEEWVGANCRFSVRSAQLYMQLAREYPQGIAPGTSLTSAIKMLEPMKSPPEQQEKITSTSGFGRRDPVAAAIKRGPLAVLQKAWAEATDVERIAFANRIQKDLPKQ